MLAGRHRKRKMVKKIARRLACSQAGTENARW